MLQANDTRSGSSINKCFTVHVDCRGLNGFYFLDIKTNSKTVKQAEKQTNQTKDQV